MKHRIGRGRIFPRGMAAPLIAWAASVLHAFRGRPLGASLLVVTLSAPVVHAAVYTWVGNGADDDFDTCGNWVVVCCLPCYPQTATSNAVIDVGSATDVDLVDATIGDIDLEGEITFGDADGDDPTLTVSGGILVGADSELTITQQASIVSS